ncbi:right-handed parallel beta-helix repeat-containing protein [Ensifer adhaerens]|uniref:right-handed parallel beta-helix repeat-containing protein n=1 Tax=Ensifer adhaerens TaxID=106592 RepID=UPI000CF1798B|nr:right-handed parallel beta-helix repeat-containing protein [Ensifer adhaerens]
MTYLATGFAIVGKYRFNITNPSYAAVGNNANNQTPAIQAAIDDAEIAALAAGGADVIFPDGGEYRITAGLRVKQGGVNLIGEGGAALYPVGNFDTIRFESASTQTYMYRNSIQGLLSFEAGKTGGVTLAGKYVADCEFELSGFNGFSGWELESFNTAKITGKLNSYTGGAGAYYGHAIGGRLLPGGGYNARSDSLILNLITGGALCAGMQGVILDGFMHTVTAERLFCINVGGNGVITQNSVSAVDKPAFLEFKDLQCDGCSSDSVRLNSGQDIVFNGGHLNRSRTGSNLYIAPGVKDVAASATRFIGATKDGIEHYGKGLRLNGIIAKNNSNNEFGGSTNVYRGLIMGSTSRDVAVSGCQFGDADTPSFQSYGIAIDGAANSFGITGNNVSHNQTGGIINNAGTGATKVVANNF